MKNIIRHFILTEIGFDINPPHRDINNQKKNKDNAQQQKYNTKQ